MDFRTPALLLSLIPAERAWAAQPDFQRYGKAAEPAPADPAITKALATIAPSRIEKTIQALVGFDWQYVETVASPSVGGSVTITLPVSKDNVIFGVRAVDAAGHRGLTVPRTRSPLSRVAS